MSNMAQQCALGELALENKLVDERQKSAQLESRITAQHNETTQLKQETDELNKRLVDQATCMETMKREMAESMSKNEEIIENAVQVRAEIVIESIANLKLIFRSDSNHGSIQRRRPIRCVLRLR